MKFSDRKQMNALSLSILLCLGACAANAKAAGTSGHGIHDGGAQAGQTTPGQATPPNPGANARQKTDDAPVQSTEKSADKDKVANLQAV